MDQLDFMDSFDEEISAFLEEDFYGCFSPENTINPSPNSSTLFNTTSQTTNYSVPSFFTSSTPILLNFSNAITSPPPNPHNTNLSHGDEPPINVSEILKPEEPPNTKRTSRIRPPSQTYDHIIAERKRREQLSNHFLTLSTIVPGLKKMDKTSVLGEAIEYMKCLKEKVKRLEEEATNTSMESMVLVKKSELVFDEEDSKESSREQYLPEIEARVCNTQILIRIQCENRRGLLTQLIGQVEKLNLSIVNTSATSFGMCALEITIITKMEKEFNLAVTEVLKRLHAAIKHVK